MLQLAPKPLLPAARELEGRLSAPASYWAAARPARGAGPSASSARWPRWVGPGQPGASVATQERLRWRELLEEFGGLEDALGILPQREALALLRALAPARAFHRGHRRRGGLILPALADPVVYYDGIWVASLSADVLPQPVAPDPFLPRRAQVVAGMPAASIEGRRTQAAALLSAWSAATPSLTLSYARRRRRPGATAKPAAVQPSRPPRPRRGWAGSRCACTAKASPRSSRTRTRHHLESSRATAARHARAHFAD